MKIEFNAYVAGEGPDEDEMRMLGIDPGDAVAGGFGH